MANNSKPSILPEFRVLGSASFVGCILSAKRIDVLIPRQVEEIKEFCRRRGELLQRIFDSIRPKI